MSLAALRQRLANVITPPPVAGGGVRTGIAALDAALSDGGLPCGRLTEIVGARGSGKTTLVRTIVAQALADKRWVAYIDAGRTLAPADWAPLAETDRLWIVRPPPSPPASSPLASSPLASSPLASSPLAAASSARASSATASSVAPSSAVAALPSPPPPGATHREARATAAPFAPARPAPGAQHTTGRNSDESLPVAHGPWCADVLLRSGTFGLVVLDGAGALARGVAVRLTRLARESHAAFVVLRDIGDDGDGRGRSGELVGGAVRLRVRRRPRGRYGGTGAVGMMSGAAGATAPGMTGGSTGGRAGGAASGAASGVASGVASGSAGEVERHEPARSPGRTSVVLEVSVEKGGTHHVVEVGCAIEVARRLCAHPQVPDRRGVAARNRRGERVAPDAPGVRRTTAAPDGAGGCDGAAGNSRPPSASRTSPASPASPIRSDPATPAPSATHPAISAHHPSTIPPASGATLAHKRRCAEPAIRRDEFLLRP